MISPLNPNIAKRLNMRFYAIQHHAKRLGHVLEVPNPIPPIHILDA
jgi:hypothetical protein